jgi:hypothetical protein
LTPPSAWPTPRCWGARPTTASPGPGPSGKPSAGRTHTSPRYSAMPARSSCRISSSSSPGATPNSALPGPTYRPPSRPPAHRLGRGRVHRHRATGRADHGHPMTEPVDAGPARPRRDGVTTAASSRPVLVRPRHRRAHRRRGRPSQTERPRCCDEPLDPGSFRHAQRCEQHISTPRGHGHRWTRCRAGALIRVWTLGPRLGRPGRRQPRPGS